MMMAVKLEVCETCHREIFGSRTCNAEPWTFDDTDTQYPPIRFGDEVFWLNEGETLEQYRRAVGPTCIECGVKIGGIHHPGCFKEQCPRCNHQAVSCDCPESEDIDE